MKKETLNINELQYQDRVGRKQSYEKIVKEHIGLVKSIAGKYYHSGKVPSCIDFDDLISWGIEGLIKAKKSFNIELKTKFSTYAYYRIKGEIADSVREEWNNRMPKEYFEKRKKLQESLSSVIEDSMDNSDKSGEKKLDEAIHFASLVHYLSNDDNIISDKKGMKDPEEELIDNSYDELWEEIKCLEYPENNIIELFYIHGLKQNDIARRLNISSSKVCRLHMNILSKLKTKLKGSIQNE